MLSFIVRRLLFIPVVLFGVTLMIFVAMSFLSPYQLVSTYIQSPEELKNQSLDDLVRKYGLDDPIHVRYFRWLKNLLRGDLGYSESANMFVAEAIQRRFPATLELTIFAIIPVILAVFGLVLWRDESQSFPGPLCSGVCYRRLVLTGLCFRPYNLMVFYGVLWFHRGDYLSGLMS